MLCSVCFVQSLRIARLNAFKINVGGLGTWILTVREQPLSLDYLVISSPGIGYLLSSRGYLPGRYEARARRVRSFLHGGLRQHRQHIGRSNPFNRTSG